MSTTLLRRHFSGCIFTRRALCCRAGGFCLVPGSFKMRHPIPRPPTLSIDLPAVKHLAQKAGSIVFYHGGSTVHGVMGWRASAERRAVLKSAGPASYPPGGGHAPRL